MNTRPSLSVIIPSYAGQKLLEKHLPDVMAQLHSGDEVIIVDDASPANDTTEVWTADQAPKYAKRGISLRCLKHPQNLRFAAAVNTGVTAAQNEFVWLLNNDVSPVTPDSPYLAWQHFHRDKDLFAVGCAEVQSPQPDAKRFGRGTGNFKRGLLVHWYDADQNSPKTLWTAGGSMFLNRSKFQLLGGMDTMFAPAYEEDRDLSYRALKRGWNLRHDPEIVVLHQHETTNLSVFGQRGIAVASWKNQFLLVWKNINDPGLLLQHHFWLLYHLTVSNIRERGAVGKGFLWALQYLPQAVGKRWRDKEISQRTDRQVLDEFGSQPGGQT